MSRVGKKPIQIPENVEVKVEDQKVIVKGPQGQLLREVRPEIKVELKEKKILVRLEKEGPKAKAFWGLTRALLANMVKGVSEGFEKKLEIEGLGFRAALAGEDLELSLGFSHPLKIKAPEGIKFSVEKNVITVSGIDKEKVSQLAAQIRKVKPPEPYKGKGIRYLGEVIKKKAGKKAVGLAG